MVDLGVSLSHGQKQMGVRVGSPELEGAMFKFDSFYGCERASQVALMVKNPPANAGNVRDAGYNLWVRKILWRRAWQPTSVFLPGESHGQRSLAGYSPWGCKIGRAHV